MAADPGTDLRGLRWHADDAETSGDARIFLMVVV